MMQWIGCGMVEISFLVWIVVFLFCFVLIVLVLVNDGETGIWMHSSQHIKQIVLILIKYFVISID